MHLAITYDQYLSIKGNSKINIHYDNILTSSGPIHPKGLD